MPTALTQLHSHIVFGTKHRLPLIIPELAATLYPFLGGIARDLRCTLVTVGGMDDHIHLLIRSRPDLSISDLVRHLKRRSSKWSNEQGNTLYWQQAYGAFAVSLSALDDVEAYIRAQPEHHKRMSFKEEFELFLGRNGIEFNPKDLWRDAG